MTTAPNDRERPSSVRPLLLLFSQWTVGITLAVALTLLFLAVNAVQLTSEGAGERLLARSVAVSTNIDVILPDLQSGLREAALETEEDKVRLPEFPIPVDLPREEALTLDGPALRQTILDEAAARVYDDGMSVWADADADSEQDIDRISVTGAIKSGLGIITSTNHTLAIVAAAVLGFLSLALAVLLLASLRGWARLVVSGAVTVAAALPSLAGAVAVRFGFRTAQEEADPFVDGLLELGVQAMWIPIRNYLALTVLGFTVLLLALVFVWVSSRWPSEAAETPAPPVP